MTNGDVVALFDQWNAALQTGDAENVANLYANGAILVPTLPNRLCHNPKEIKRYFADFLKKGPSGKIDEANVRWFDNIAINSGRYAFTLKDGDLIPARFTFAYQRDGDRWLIAEHHSSAMPE